MYELIKPKKSIWRWLKWMLLGIGIILIGGGIYFYYRYFIWMKMDALLISKAESALSSGITIEDDKDDFLTKADLGKEMDAEKSYGAPYVDIKALFLGADDDYPYVKIALWGKIPKKPGSIDGITLTSVGPQTDIMNEKGEVQSILATEYGWMPVFKFFSLNTCI